MLTYRVVCVGRRAHDPLLDAVDRYVDRLSRYARVEIIRVRDASLAKERDAIAGKLRDRDHVVALDERGADASTAQLAERVGRWEREATGSITFLIGGADGLHPDLKKRARDTMALSRLTLPHRLALVVLVEQLYRAHSVLRNEPYHRA
jgi:23S rRNA (pseudouridine1915-N3)-methyltransferase